MARQRWPFGRGARNPLRFLGAGLITGVADDDPSGIATYSQAGAQFGLNMLWTMPLTWPLMSAIQSMCGRIGRVSGQGLAGNIRTHMPRPVLAGVVALLLAANTLNIAADVAAMGEVGELVTGINRHVMTFLFVAVTLGLQVAVPYHRYVRFLKWLTLSLLAYAAVVCVVHVPWAEVAARTLWPHLALDAPTAAMVTGLFGTTISPYLFFWQASEEVEDLALRKARRMGPAEITRIKWDTWSGMGYSNLASFLIILATAVTLHVAGVTQIETAGQAAQALAPVAGRFAFWLFALGILGVGLIGVPVLAGSAGYAAAEAMGWAEGLERNLREARGFYGVIVVSVLLGLVVQYSPISPMRALFWSAVINGVVAVPLMVVVIMLASSKKVMGEYAVGAWQKFLGWAGVAVMAISAACMLLPG